MEGVHCSCCEVRSPQEENTGLLEKKNGIARSLSTTTLHHVNSCWRRRLGIHWRWYWKCVYYNVHQISKMLTRSKLRNLLQDNLYTRACSTCSAMPRVRRHRQKHERTFRNHTKAQLYQSKGPYSSTTTPSKPSHCEISFPRLISMWQLRRRWWRFDLVTFNNVLVH